MSMSGDSTLGIFNIDPSIFLSTFDLNQSLRNDIPVLGYGDSPTKFERLSGFLQDSIDLTDQLVFSVEQNLRIVI